MSDAQNTNGTPAPQPVAEPEKRVIGRPFPKGVSANPGGRPRGLGVYLEESMRTITVERWRVVVDRALKDAEQGNRHARAWLSKILGLDKLEIGITNGDATAEQRRAALASLDVGRQRLFTELAAKLYGPSPSPVEPPSNGNGAAPHN